jgi:uncharacterized membrane protein
MKIPKKHHSDLILVLIWVIFVLVSIISPVFEGSFIRTALGVPVVLFIPGYVLIATLFPKKNYLNFTERTVLSLGLSIAIVPLLGLLLNFTVGIKLVPVVFTLCIYTVALALIAVYRRDKLPEGERFIVPLYRLYEVINNEISADRSRTDKILTGILISAIVLAAGTLYFVITMPKAGEKFTEFYILGPSGKAENYPTTLKHNSSSQIMVGVVNHEYAFANYTVQIALNESILSDTRLSLNHNETWENNLTFTPDRMENNTKLEFWLFKEDNFTAPYRELHLWVNVTK